MKKLFLLLCYVLPSVLSNAQKRIILQFYTQEVPEGKKWVIPTNIPVFISVSQATLNGNACSASMLAVSPSISEIVEGPNEMVPSNHYFIRFRALKRLTDASENVLAITPVTFSRYDWETNRMIPQTGNLVFYPGQHVGVRECLIELQAFEYALTAAEQQTIKAQRQKAAAAEAAEQAAERKAEEADRQEKLKARKTKEDGLKIKLAANQPFDYDDLDNDPITELSDQQGFANEMAPFLQLDKASSTATFFSAELIFDATGKIISAVNDHADNAKLLATIQKYYKVTPAEISINGKKTHVPLKATIKFSKLKATTDKVSCYMSATENDDNTLAISLNKISDNKKKETDTAYINVMYDEVVKRYVNAKKKDVNKKMIKADRTIYSFLVSFNTSYLGTNDINYTSLSNYSVSKQPGSNRWIADAALIGAGVLIK